MKPVGMELKGPAEEGERNLIEPQVPLDRGLAFAYQSLSGSEPFLASGAS